MWHAQATMTLPFSCLRSWLETWTRSHRPQILRWKPSRGPNGPRYVPQCALRSVSAPRIAIVELESCKRDWIKLPDHADLAGALGYLLLKYGNDFTLFPRLVPPCIASIFFCALFACAHGIFATRDMAKGGSFVEGIWRKYSNNFRFFFFFFRPFNPNKPLFMAQVMFTAQPDIYGVKIDAIWLCT